MVQNKIKNYHSDMISSATFFEIISSVTITMNVMRQIKFRQAYIPIAQFRLCKFQSKTVTLQLLCNIQIGYISRITLNFLLAHIEKSNISNS